MHAATVRWLSSATLALSLFLAYSSFLFSGVTALDPSAFSVKYDKGAYGHTPLLSYHSTGVTSPRFNVIVDGETEQLISSEPQKQDARLLTFLAPHGYKVKKPCPVIVDEDGTLIWTNDTYGPAFDFRVQKYKDTSFLTFWVGDNHVKGHGSGTYFMLDQSYNLFKSFRAGNGLDGDLHEFTITDGGTALITIYQRVEVDLSAVSDEGARGIIWDCLIQEMDVESETVLFEWRASDHVDLSLSRRPLGKEGSDGSPWDWFHLNSVHKDDRGNYLISARYLDSLIYVSGQTLEPLWFLGGKRNDFTDTCDGNATDFAYQHDARWAPEGVESSAVDANVKSITVFDNAVDYEHQSRAPRSRGLHLSLNLAAMSVGCIATFASPNDLVAPSQGSVQILPSGDVFVGFGDVAAFAQFSASGRLRKEVHFGPAKDFGSDYLQSYRVLKFAWTGTPDTRPAVAVRDKTIFVSWNGATEVKEWALEKMDGDDKDSSSEEERGSNTEASIFVDRVPKDGFETSINFEEAALSKYVRLVALDGRGAALGSSSPIDWAHERKLTTRIYKSVASNPLPVVAVALSLLGGAVVYRLGAKPAARIWTRFRDGRMATRSSRYIPLAQFAR